MTGPQDGDLRFGLKMAMTGPSTSTPKIPASARVPVEQGAKTAIRDHDIFVWRAQQAIEELFKGNEASLATPATANLSAQEGVTEGALLSK